MKKQINKLAALLLLSLITLNACNIDCTEGSGRQVSEKRNIDNFENIDLRGVIKLEIIQDGTTSLEITADDNILPELKTSVSGNTLEIGLEGSYCNVGNISIVLHTKRLNGIDASGTSEIVSNTIINSDEFKLNLSGASKVTLKLNTGNLSTESSGSSSINLIGQARKHDIDMSGATKLSALDFVVNDYNIESSGSSNCQINVMSTLNANTSGASEIIYKGSPKDIVNKKSGSSTIVPYKE
jgi:hypothetical protein